MFLFGALAIIVSVVLLVLFMRGELSSLVDSVLTDTSSTAQKSLRDAANRKLQFPDVFNEINGDTLYAWGGGEDVEQAYSARQGQFNIGTASDADSSKLHSTDWAKKYGTGVPMSESLSLRKSFSQPYSMNRGAFSKVSPPMSASDRLSMPAAVKTQARVTPVLVPAAAVVPKAVVAATTPAPRAQISGIAAAKPPAAILYTPPKK